MKNLKNKTEITKKNLINNVCDYKGKRLGYDNEKKVYLIGSHFEKFEDYYETLQELKESLI